ncbi:MAG: ATP-binding protein [Rhodobacteraceae bacterium]|nr:ATP-binding protein [Paracoccaceae bacterium]
MQSLIKPHSMINRHAESQVLTALNDTRIVALAGPRQSGKTTLVHKIAKDQGMSFVTLDDHLSRHFANYDPAGFLQQHGRAVIDEIQRAPELFLELKKNVDEMPQPGRFLITGSVDLFKRTISPDSLAGRVEAITLLPFSQSEIEQIQQPEFLEHAFSENFPAYLETGRTLKLVERIVTGGYPEVFTRKTSARRRVWFQEYVRALATRDVTDISLVLKTQELMRLLDHAATAAGQLVNLSRIASQLGVDSKTVDQWLALFEQMFVIKRVPAWHRNTSKRLVKAPKLHFLDSGLLAALSRTELDDIRTDRARLGSLLEGFVYSELHKQAAQSSEPTYISHYRDKDKVEVDFVIERMGKIVGIEVKAAVSVKPGDFSGLNRLKNAADDAFVCGIVLHDGENILRAGDKMLAMPVNRLWL